MSTFSAIKSKLVNGDLVFFVKKTGTELFKLAKDGTVSILSTSFVPPVDNADGLTNLRVARATFNPSGVAGHRTIAAHALGDNIPANAIICGGFVEVETQINSADTTGTLAVSLEAANDIINAANIVGAPWSTAGRKAILPKANTPESTSVKASVARKITFTVGTTALTVGKATAFLFYVVGA